MFVRQLESCRPLARREGNTRRQPAWAQTSNTKYSPSPVPQWQSGRPRSTCAADDKQRRRACRAALRLPPIRRQAGRSRSTLAPRRGPLRQGGGSLRKRRMAASFSGGIFDAFDGAEWQRLDGNASAIVRRRDFRSCERLRAPRESAGAGTRCGRCTRPAPGQESPRLDCIPWTKATVAVPRLHRVRSRCLTAPPQTSL